MNIQLTISLLASDRPAALERCLDSLRPLLMQIPSELIIIATGTDERVRETASRYTDQVLPFSWCGDFSAARNTGLQAARGEWFMYLDDDEWFEDITEIRDFFLSGEYKNYGTAFYKVRNYLNWDGIQYFDFYALRLMKRASDTRFENPIHEELVPRRGASKFFDTYVHHYGYVVDKNKADTKKTSRNIPMLLQNIRRNPDYIKNYVQLTQEYYVQGEWDKAEDACRKGRRLCRGKAGAQWYIQWFQVYWADIQSAKGDAGKARKEILSILEKEHPSETVRLYLYRKLTLLCTKLKKHEETLHYGKEFEALLTYMEENPKLWEEQSYGDLNEGRIKNPEQLILGRLRCAEAAFYLEDSGMAADFLKLLPWEDETQVQKYYPLFDGWGKQKEAVFRGMLKNLTELKVQNPYLQLCTAVFPETESENGEKSEEDGTQRPEAAGQKKQRQELLLSCTTQTVSLYLKERILKEAVLSEMELAKFAQALDLDTWNTCIQQLVNNLPVSELSLSSGIGESIEELKAAAPLHGLRLEKLVREKQLIREYPAGEELKKRLSDYSRCVLSYYKRQYREELFEEREGEYLPADCRFALYVSRALECMEEARLPEAVRRFRSALKYHPAMTGVIQEVIRQMKSRLDNPAHNAGEEFQMLAGQMKGNLRLLFEAGQYEEAVLILNQLSALLPEDLELLRIRQEILRKMSGPKKGEPLSVLR